MEFVNCGMGIMASVVIVSYLLYTLSPEVISRFNCNYLYITSLFVILCVLRYLQITFVQEKCEDPTKIFCTDPFLIINVLAWLATFFLMIS